MWNYIDLENYIKNNYLRSVNWEAMIICVHDACVSSTIRVYRRWTTLQRGEQWNG